MFENKTVNYSRLNKHIVYYMLLCAPLFISITIITIRRGRERGGEEEEEFSSLQAGDRTMRRKDDKGSA